MAYAPDFDFNAAISAAERALVGAELRLTAATPDEYDRAKSDLRCCRINLSRLRSAAAMTPEEREAKRAAEVAKRKANGVRSFADICAQRPWQPVPADEDSGGPGAFGGGERVIRSTRGLS